MDKPFFSIVIPTLNEEKFIGRLLTDLVKQSKQNFEVVVVDGKSSDKTQDLVKIYLEKLPLQFLITEKGVSHQRNVGAKIAKGQFLVFFDADVQIPANFLSLLQHKIQNYGGEVFTTYIKPDSRNIADKVIAQYFNWGIAFSALLDKPMIGGFNFIVSKSAFERVGGFDERIVHGEDIDLSMRLQKAGYPMSIFKTPVLTFSLRRYRAEGHLNVLRKHAQVGIHLLIKGPITHHIFSYPMGGDWYKKNRRRKLNTKIKLLANQYLKEFKRVLFEEVS